MRKNLFLYLALACFVALVAIFIADGYIGIYDTVYITTGEREQKIEPEYWLRRDYAPPGAKAAYYIPAEWGERIFFRYEIDNRRFSTYSTPIQASVWKENEKILDLFSEDKSIKPFDKVMVEWTLSTEDLAKAGFGVDRDTQYTVKIERGEVERRIVVGFRYPVEPVYPKAVPPPSPR